MIPKQFEKLPAYVKDEIEVLRANVRSLTQANAELAGFEPTRSLIGSSYTPEGYLDDTWGASFRLGADPASEHEYVEARVRQDHQGEWYLEVRTDMMMRIVPASGNLVHIYRGRG